MRRTRPEAGESRASDGGGLRGGVVLRGAESVWGRVPRGAGLEAAVSLGCGGCVLRGCDRRLVSLPVGALLSSYGWYILLACVAIYLIVQKISPYLRMRPSSQQGATGTAVGSYSVGSEGCVWRC